MINILTDIHFASYFSFEVIISEINPTDHTSITASHFPNEEFHEADCDSVESKRDNNY